MFAVLALLASVASASPFIDWAANNNRTYSSVSEMEYREYVWHSNLVKVEEHNAAGHSWTMAMNKFADLTSSEFAEQYITGGYDNFIASRRVFPHRNFFMPPFVAPVSVDWTTKGAVTPVKNQGQCGSCWAFSTTGSVEGAWFLSNGTLVSLSEQQLVDCSSAEGNQGCNGGLMDSAFEYIIKNKGLTTEANYPYTAQDGTCSASKAKAVAATIKSYTDVATNSEAALEAAIAQQPVSVAVEADQNSFQLYSGGVLTAACGANLDHGVLAVGYGTDSASGEQYWKVKNSWGADWGVNGYILLGKGKTYNGGAGQCGILSDPSFPTA
jgi:cathepsin L